MPLEISEIAVKVADGQPETGPAESAPPPPSAPGRMRQLVEACVRQVLAALRMRGQR